MLVRTYSDIKVSIKTEDILKENLVYKLIFPNGKVYIGQTTNTLKDRIYKHCISATNLKSSAFNTIKARAIRKYQKFEVEVLYEGEDLTQKEIEFIELYDATNHSKGYNSADGGIGGITHKNPIEQYSLKGEYIRTFDSCSDAAREINPDKLKSITSKICMAAKGERKTAYKYIWKYPVI